jgi:predicted TIM-barrel fold metal-dependent hydrolase
MTGRITRRACLRSALGGLTIAGLSTIGSAQTSHAGAQPATDKYIDVHVHLGQPWASREPLTVDVLLRWMDEHEISHAVVLPLISPEAWYYPISTDWVLRQTAPHRDRLIPFGDVDPRTNYLRTDEDVLDVLKRYVDAGARGLGEHKCGGPIDSPGNLRIFRAAAELKLPVLFHMDTIRNTDRPGLPGLEKVLQEAPGANFIGHAPGWWASISGDVATAADLGGYAKGPVAPGGAIDRLMDKYPNLYGEFSAGSGANSITRDLEFGRKFIIRRADRLLFGTDYLAVGQEISQFELFESMDLPAEVKTKLYRENAKRILDLS